MVEDFEIGECAFYVENGKISFRSPARMYGIVTEIDPEKLKEWLDEATKPRYYVKDKQPHIIYIPHRLEFSFEIIDREDSNTAIAHFRTCKKAKAYCKYLNEKEAEKLCKELNEKGGED